ncbi:hypothetical protein KP509_34G040700 [Ceratopteris richardii]|uniref:Uncharacterized protein n=1 Tax=Ceratopteris richardii TaxID=49495 RepID=A0A8T2QKG9_CERRI|nr:hypothetical protein KP509_34G040700 [Ceratopteris richardii]
MTTMASLTKISHRFSSFASSNSSVAPPFAVACARSSISASFGSHYYLQQTSRDKRAHHRALQARKSIGFHVLATAAEIPTAETENAVDTQPIKEFLEELKSLGRIRIIVNTGVGVLESVTSLEKLFYHNVPGKGEYANLMNKEENVDFHLLLPKVKSAKFTKGKSMTGNIPTYMIRLLDDEEKAAALFLVMWKPDTKGEYDEGQVEAFESLLGKHGDTCYFKK